jgi:hypothetical protein
MSRKRDKLKGFFGVKSNSSSPVLTTAAPSVGSSVPMAVLPTGTSKEPCEPEQMLITVARGSSSNSNSSCISKFDQSNAEQPKRAGVYHV